MPNLVTITTPATSHIGAALKALLSMGWKPYKAPEDGRLSRNGQLITLRWDQRERSVRLFIYKVTGSGRNAHERRIEITSTYNKSLAPADAHDDIVLGYETSTGIFVGIDARRLHHGGPTGNASSFIDPAAVQRATSTRILIRPRQAEIFGLEYQAYFGPHRLPEYLLNAPTIHQGAYDGRGYFSGSRASRTKLLASVASANASDEELVLDGPGSVKKPPVWGKTSIWRAYEIGDTKNLKGLSQEEFKQLYERQLEIGVRGEELVLNHERKRLRAAGRIDLAENVDWISPRQPFLGYDILSYEVDGTAKYIEVKSTTGAGRRFPMSANEWNVATTKKDRYYILRVTSVDGDHPFIEELRDPVTLLANGALQQTTLTWVIKY